MNEKTSTQTQKNEGFTGFQAKLAEELFARMTGAFDEIARLEGKGVSHITRAMEQYDSLVKAQMAYAQQMSAAWRQLVLDSARRVVDASTAT